MPKNNNKKNKKKKVIKGLKCSLCLWGVGDVSYTDLYRLKKFVTRRGKIIPRSRSGNCAKHQRSIAKAIKRARVMSLMPYTSVE